MTRLTWFQCMILLSFWLAGLASFFIGGLPLVGHVVQVFMGVVAGKGLREVYLWGKREEVMDHYYKWQIYREWRENSRRKGLE